MEVELFHLQGGDATDDKSESMEESEDDSVSQQGAAPVMMATQTSMFSKWLQVRFLCYHRCKIVTFLHKKVEQFHDFGCFIFNQSIS